MPSFPPVDEQLAYLRKGAAEIIRESDLRERLEKSPPDRQAHAREGRLRSHRARPASRPHRAHAQAQALPGHGPHRHLPHRRLHRPHRRSHRAARRRARRSPASRSTRTPRPTRRRSSRSSTATRPRSASTASGSSKLGYEGFVRLAAKFTVSQMLEREDFHKRFDGREADRHARAALSHRAGLRLGRARGRRRTRRHRPEVQPARWDASCSATTASRRRSC